MATATIQVAYEAETTSLKATVNEINQINDKVVEKANDAAKKIKKEWTGIGSTIAAGFSGNEVKKALDNQADAIDNLGKSGKKLATDLKVLNDEIKKLEAEGKGGTDAFKKLVDEAKKLEKQVDNTGKSSKSLTGQLRGLKQELAALEIAGQDGSEAFNKILIAAAKLEDQIGDTRARVKILASDTFKFDVAVGATQALASGFEVAQGAAALFGEESEDLQKVIAKVTAATAVANGVNQLAALIKEENALKTGIETAALTTYNVVVGTSTGLMKAFRIALAATGVGLLVVGLILLIENFEKIKDAIMGTSDATRAFEAAQKSANAELAKSKVTLKDLADTQADLNDKLLVAQGELSKEAAEANKIQRDATKKNISDTTALIAEREKLNKVILLQKDAVAEAQKESDKITAGSPARLKEAVKARLDAANQELKVSTDLRDKLTANIKEVQQANLTAAKTEVTIINTEAEQDAADKRAELIKAANAKALEAAKKAAEDQAKAREQLAAKELQLFESQLSAEDKIRSDSNNEVIELEKQFAAAKFKAGSAEELAAAKALGDAIAIIRTNANKQIEVLDKQTQEKILAERLEAAKAAEGATTDEQIKALDAQKKIVLESTTLTQKEKLEIIKGFDAQINKLLIDSAEARANTEINTLKTLELKEGSSLERRIELINKEAEKRKTEAKNTIKDKEELDSKIKLIDAETQKDITNTKKDETEKQIALIAAYAQAVASVFNGISELSKIATENRIADITLQSEKELEAINASTELENDKERQRAALAKRTNAAIAAEKTKQAKADKALAIFQATISVAQQVAQNIANPVLAIIIAAAGAIQIAAIAARPIPKFERGGVIGGRRHSDGGTIVEAERDEYIVNRRQSMRYRSELDAINSSSDAFRKLIEQRYVRPALMDYVAGNRNKQGVTVNASLNSKSMEKELRGMRKDLSKRNMIININQQDSRYLWQ